MESKVKNAGWLYVEIERLYLHLRRLVSGRCLAYISRSQRRPTSQANSANASIIKSIDFGRTRTRPAAVNYQAPMFPGRRFATPYFIEFGRKGWAHANVGDFVYALPNNGFFGLRRRRGAGPGGAREDRPPQRFRLGVLHRQRRRLGNLMDEKHDGCHTDSQ